MTGMSRLSSYPYVTVRIACMRCPRKGQYRLARLAERYGAEATLTEVLQKLSIGCPRADTERHQSVHDRCAAFYPDLVTPTPPDVPPAAPGALGLRIVGGRAAE